MRAVVVATGAILILFVTQSVVGQRWFVDDAKRSVELPARVKRIMAAGAPAEVMLYTLAPDMLVGRNRVPEGADIEFFPPAYRKPVPILQLPEVDDPAKDADLLKLKPDVYIDYGTIDPDYIAAVDAVQRRTKVPSVLLDGYLDKIPQAYRRVGAALGIASRGEQLGAAAERLLTKYRNALAPSPPRVYVACSADGYSPCFADDRGAEHLAWLGGVNVAGPRPAPPRRPLTIEEIRALKPQVIVTNGAAGSAARLRSDPAWLTLEAVKAGRVYSWPELPFSWASRPPSVNRLPGLPWLASVAAGRPFDAAFNDEIRRFYKEFYHLDLTDAQLAKLLAP